MPNIPKNDLVILSVLVLIVLLVVIISMIANYQFNRNIDKGVVAFYRDVENKHEVICQTDLEGLPRPVQNWLQYSQVVGKERIVAARTKQDITMRLKENQPWLKAQTEQYFRTDALGFIWAVDIKIVPLLHIAGRDQYIEGRGNMLIRLLSFITVANGSGKEIDQGTLLRYLAESVLLPTAALSDTIKWEEIDSNSANATMSYKGVTASGIFTFREKGEVLNFVAQRYGDFDGGYRMETWSIDFKEYKEFSGANVPSQGDVIWKLKTGDFHWYHFNVEEAEYNELARY